MTRSILGIILGIIGLILTAVWFIHPSMTILFINLIVSDIMFLNEVIRPKGDSNEK